MPELAGIPIILCDRAPVDVYEPLVFVAGDDCPYCGDPISGHDRADADTKTVRRIETEAGTIVGDVDRVTRRVRWHLECPDCAHLIPFTDDTFHGRGPLVCECGWKSRPTGHKERSENGSVYTYHDYSELAFGGETAGGCATDGEGVHAGMTF